MIPGGAWDVVVIGAGPAGLMAALHAAECGRRTLLLEKNPRPGVKVLMSGGNRCNLTHATDARGIVDAFGRQGPFLHSSLAAFDPASLIQFVESEGVTTKVEPLGKVFPVSDDAADVLAALLNRLNRSGAQLSLAQPVSSIATEGQGFRLQTPQQVLQTPRLVLATGGCSYPGCGTTGDGYRWAEQLGHTVVPPKPALTPITTDVLWVRSLRGVTIPDVAVQIVSPSSTPQPQAGESAKRAALAQARGSMLFTHFGLSGPPILDVSRVVSRHAQPRELRLVCDFLPDENLERLAAWLDAQFRQDGKRRLVSILADRLPRRLVECLLEAESMPLDRRAAEFSRRDRQRVLEACKRLTLPISGVMGFRKAEVTSGGVSLDEVDSRTLQSKRCPGLHLVGEVLDLDGPIGGYNFQAAFSTGWLAGQSV